MGTRADFYVGRGESAVWLGSVAYDGYPNGFKRWPDLFNAKAQEDWTERVREMLSEKRDASTPAHGWPWPWEDSNTTDYAYAFEDGVVYGNRFGHGWWPVLDGEAHQQSGDCEEDCKGPHQPDAKPTPFPKMSTDTATMGPRSGMLLLRI